MKKLFMGFVTAALLTVCLCVPAFAASACVPDPDASIYDCQYFMDFYRGGALDFSVFKGFYDDVDHYLCCSDCGAFAASALLSGEPYPHADADCAFCKAYSSDGLEIMGFLPSSSDVLPSITTLVTASIDWLTAFALCIISTPLFLIFVCCIFVGLGIALIKRSIHL